jgi:hypothetical protein
MNRGFSAALFVTALVAPLAGCGDLYCGLMLLTTPAPGIAPIEPMSGCPLEGAAPAPADISPTS